MVLDEIKNKVDLLSPEERHELSAYLTKLQLEADPDFWKEIRRVAEDKDPAKWVRIDEVT